MGQRAHPDGGRRTLEGLRPARYPDLMSAFALLLALVPSVFGQTGSVAETAAPAAPSAGVAPLLLSSLDVPFHPLADALALQVGRLASLGPLEKLSPERAAAALEPEARGGASERLAAAALAHALQKPGAARTLAERVPRLQATALASFGRPRPDAADHPGLSALSEALHKDPALQYVFDGRGPPSLELDGLDLKRERLRRAGGDPVFLGQGDLGAVYVHPKEDGAVVKIAVFAPETVLFHTITYEEATTLDAEVGRRVAAAGAGPRVLGTGTISGRPAIVKERVFGDTLEELIRARKFGEEEYRLVLEMLDRMADGRVRVRSLRPPNIMIGRTKLNPERRAYVVDGGELLPVGSEETHDALRASLQVQDTAVSAYLDPYMGPVVNYKPFDRILREGVARSRQKPLLARLKDGLSRLVPWARSGSR